MSSPRSTTSKDEFKSILSPRLTPDSVREPRSGVSGTSGCGRGVKSALRGSDVAARGFADEPIQFPAAMLTFSLPF